MGPGDRLALGIEAGGDAVKVIRPVHVVLDVFLAAPEHLHRPGHLLGDLHRPGDEIHLEPPAEAAAQEMVVRSEEHTSELQSLTNLVCRLLLEKKKQTRTTQNTTEQDDS